MVLKSMVRQAWLALAILVLSTATTLAGSPKPASEPILRLETGMHTARIDQISVALDRNILLTVSEDKTARLWSLQGEGKQIRVLRPPIGDGVEGKLYAGALSPDGTLAAVAGATGYAWDRKYSVYVFEVNSGRILRRLSDLPNVIHVLSFSLDGKYLAAGIGQGDHDEAGSGIHVWATAGWERVWKDEDYRGAVYGLAFGGAGQLFTTSYDGLLRSYDSVGRLSRKVKAPGGKRPFRIAVSSDGDRVAVGYEDAGRVDVLSPALESIWTPSTSGIDRTRSMGLVAWSTDGTKLYAASNSRNGANQTFVRTWSDRGRGGYADAGVAHQTIGGLAALSDSRLAFASAEPSWGVLGASGIVSALHTAGIVELANEGSTLGLSPNGEAVRFDAVSRSAGSTGVAGVQPVGFTLSQRRFMTDGFAKAPVRPEPSNSHMRLTGDGHSAPSLNGRTLPLELNERWRAAAVQGSQLLLGTEWSLRLFDERGRQIWAKDAPGSSKAVSISPDGRLAVAAFADGTIRWFDMRNGAELLAFFPHRDRRRWVAWTPEGFYDASVDGDRLLFWHLNQAADQEALEYPVERFSERFNKMDIVRRALDADGLRSPPGPPGAIPRPPVLQILFPQAVPPPLISASPADITYQVISPTPISDLRVSFDGERLSVPPLSGTVSEVFTVSVPVPRRSGTLTIVARNSDGESEPAGLRVMWAGEQKSDPDWRKPDLYVLAVGVSKYKDPSVNQLNYAGADARDISTVLKAQQGGGLYRNVSVTPLVDEAATRDGIRAQLERLTKTASPRDVAIVFMAGHGERDSDGSYFFKPYDFDPASALISSISDTELKKLLSRVPAKLIVFLDTCHAGSFDYTARGSRLPDMDGLANMLASGDRRVVVFASSTGDQLAQEKPEWGHGAFTKALLEAFRTEAADKDQQGTVSVNKLEVYLSDRVKSMTDGQQTPLKPKTAPNADVDTDFVFALVRS